MVTLTTPTKVSEVPVTTTNNAQSGGVALPAGTQADTQGNLVPNVNPNTAPQGTVVPLPGMTASGMAHPDIKAGLEAAANANGPSVEAGTSAVPTRDLQMTPEEMSGGAAGIKAYNDRIAKQRGTTNTTLTSPTSPPTPTMANFDLGSILSKLTPPTPPNMGVIQSQAETQQGVLGIQGRLTQLNDQLTQAQNDIQNRQAQEASKPGVIASIINGRMRMISAEQSKALNDLKLQIRNETTQLHQANTAVQAIMKNSQTDFNNAEKQYQDSFNDAIKVYSAEETQKNKAQTTAKANAQVIINSFKGSSTGFNSITPDQKAQWATLETQAGLPAGTIETAVRNELNITKFTKGSDGNMYITGTDNNGVPYTAKIEGSYGAGSGTKPKTTPSPEEKAKQATIKSFNADLSNQRANETREEMIQRLRTKYQGKVDPDAIAKMVYEAHPDKK